MADRAKAKSRAQSYTKSKKKGAMDGMTVKGGHKLPTSKGAGLTAKGRASINRRTGSNYEGRKDLGNIYPGDGVKFAGTGWIQVTGRYNHQAFSDYLDRIGQSDYRIMDEGKEYTSKHYPWSISGYWWHQNNMNAFCSNRTKCTNYQIDEVGAKVNGRMRPNGADDRIKYTDVAYRTLLG